MIKSRDILGMNAREERYTRLNSKGAKKYTYSKILAKDVFIQNEVPTPALYAKFESMDEVNNFNWSQIETSFVVKPAGGNAGKGILVVKRKGKINGNWVDIEGKQITENDLKYHISNILEGQYSTYGTQHMAFVEERIPIYPTLKKYVYGGTPDVRVVVYNKVPVMAMLRLPTKESEGRANLHQGAIGVGVDIASGVTLGGVLNGKIITEVPDTKIKVNGVKLPFWVRSLKLAVRGAEVAGLGYAGVDIFFHMDKGPMIVELNANPGLGIQLANEDGLRRRLERVEDLTIRNIDHGVRVGRALFGERFSDQVTADEGLQIVDVFEDIEVSGKEDKWLETVAKIDTGVRQTAIDRDFAQKCGLLEENNVLWKKKVASRGDTLVIEVKLKIEDRVIKTAATVINRKRYKTKVIVGRDDLSGFLVRPIEGD